VTLKSWRRLLISTGFVSCTSVGFPFARDPVFRESKFTLLDSKAAPSCEFFTNPEVWLAQRSHVKGPDNGSARLSSQTPVLEFDGCCEAVFSGS
jgi:hypothetical protein